MELEIRFNTFQPAKKIRYTAPELNRKPPGLLYGHLQKDDFNGSVIDLYSRIVGTIYRGCR